MDFGFGCEGFVSAKRAGNECAGIPTGPGEARSSGTPRCRFLVDRLRRTGGSAALRPAHLSPRLRATPSARGRRCCPVLRPLLCSAAKQKTDPLDARSVPRWSLGAVWVTPAGCGQPCGRVVGNSSTVVHQPSKRRRRARVVHTRSGGVIHAAGRPEHRAKALEASYEAKSACVRVPRSWPSLEFRMPRERVGARVGRAEQRSGIEEGSTSSVRVRARWLRAGLPRSRTGGLRPSLRDP